MKKKNTEPKLIEDGFALKIPFGGGFVFPSISVDRTFTLSQKKEWTGSKVVKVKIIEQ